MLKLVEEVVSPVYAVGGAVRDELMGRTPKDYDFATPLTPDEIEEAVRAYGRRPYLVGKRFGTIGFKMNGQLVEVTTFRNEKYEKGSRKPKVEFVKDITADLNRRDFTINSIARRNDRYIDPSGGRLDILRKIVRATGHPKTRFKEDPLRMLRAARFASELGFEIDNNTEGYASKLSHKILSVSRERWVMEMDKLLVSDKPSTGLDFLARTRLLNYMVPELSIQVAYDQNSSFHGLELWEHTLKVVDGVSNDVELRWAALLHDVAKPFVRTENKKSGYHNYVKHDLLGAELVEKTGLYLKWSTKRRENVIELVFNHLREDSPLKAADDAAKKVRE